MGKDLYSRLSHVLRPKPTDVHAVEYVAAMLTVDMLKEAIPRITSEPTDALKVFFVKHFSIFPSLDTTCADHARCIVRFSRDNLGLFYRYRVYRIMNRIHELLDLVTDMDSLREVFSPTTLDTNTRISILRAIPLLRDDVMRKSEIREFQVSMQPEVADAILRGVFDTYPILQSNAITSDKIREEVGEQRVSRLENRNSICPEWFIGRLRQDYDKLYITVAKSQLLSRQLRQQMLDLVNCISVALRLFIPKQLTPNTVSNLYDATVLSNYEVDNSLCYGRTYSSLSPEDALTMDVNAINKLYLSVDTNDKPHDAEVIHQDIDGIVSRYLTATHLVNKLRMR